MEIKRLKMINFKGFQELELSLGTKNLIEGKNGQGKSTIRDAVFFCFYGRTSEGSLADSSKYILDGKLKALVEIEFERGGEIFTVRRERTEKQTRITYLDGSQSDDDSIITQRELDSMLPRYELMQAVFNIGSFMRLPDKEKRDFILKITPQVDRKEIYLKLGGKEEDIGRFELDFDNIDSSHKKLLKYRRESDEELTRLGAVIEDSKPIEIPELTAEDPSEELKELQERQEEKLKIESEWFIYRSKLSQAQEVEKENERIKEKLSHITIEDIEKPDEEKYHNLLRQKNELSPTISIPEDRCPTCLQEIGAEHQNKVAKLNNIRTAKRMELDKTIKDTLGRLNEERARYETNEDKKREKESLESRLTSITFPQEPTEKPQEIDQERLHRANDRLREFQRQTAEINLLTKQEAERVARIEEMRKRAKFLVEEINEVNRLLPILSPKGIPAEEMRMKLEPLLVEMRKLLPDIRIETIEMLKNGLDVKEVFQIYANEIEYSKLSTGQRMRVDCALSQIIDALSGNQVGMYFLDNSESIDELPEIKPQFFIAKVTNTNLKIT